MTVAVEGGGLSAEHLDDLYNPEGDGEHPQITRAMCREAVALQDTVSGYWQWLAHRLTEDPTSAVKPRLAISEGPVFSAPLNAPPGPYVQAICQSGRAPAATLLEFVREAVLKAGYDPDGKGVIGPPTVHGIAACTYAMWFYDKAQQPTAGDQPEPHFIVIQEGGTSAELYVQSLESAGDADAYRVDCTQEGGYRTSPYIEVPASLAGHPLFYGIAEKLVRATAELELAAVPADTESNNEEQPCAAR
ncbi:hypothetical protein [Cupriavidus sp. CP313]